MSKSDLRARPVFHRKKDSIDAHLTIVFAALAVARYLQDRTGVSIKRLVQVLRPLRTVTITIAGQPLEPSPASDPMPSPCSTPFPISRGAPKIGPRCGTQAGCARRVTASCFRGQGVFMWLVSLVGRPGDGVRGRYGGVGRGLRV